MPARYDLHIQLLPEADQKDTYKFMSFGFSGGEGVRGFQMLINMWLKCFLTPRGSDPGDLAYGTEFTKLVGSTLDIDDAQDVVMLAVDQCNSTIRRFQQGTLSLAPSERLSNASVVDFVKTPSAPGFDVTIEIRNKAQNRLLFNLPLVSTG